MKAVGLYKYLPIEDPRSLVDLDIRQPNLPASGHDLLVAIKAISVNPVDTKVRRGLIPSSQSIIEQNEKNTPRILGWDAAGEVIEAGSDCTLFKKGDAVYYAGSITRPLGTNCEFHLVDERLVGRKPKSLSFEEAAALPLTTITAWEALYDRLSVHLDAVKGGTAATSQQSTMPADTLGFKNDDRQDDHRSSILIIGGAGGVGSIAIQLAKNLVNQSSLSSLSSTASSSYSSLPGVNLIATASRTESVEWCMRMGADYVVNHHKDLRAQIKEFIGIEYVDYILCLNDTDGHFESMKQLVAPQGKICSIVEAENLRKAHRKLESGTTIGKIVLSGF